MELCPTHQEPPTDLGAHGLGCELCALEEEREAGVLAPVVTRVGRHVRVELAGAGRISISLVHLNTGWRYWARWTRDAEGHGAGFDAEAGLPPDGFATEGEAIRAAEQLLVQGAA